MKILITGATGLIGNRLIEVLYSKGHDDIRILTRNKVKTQKQSSFPIEVFEWNPELGYIEAGALENIDIIFHLAGESVAGGKWSEQKKKEIFDSRNKSSTLLINTIKTLQKKPQKIISASAIGIYGNRDSEILTEESQTGEDFLASVCKKWEEVILNHQIEGLKSHVIRIGLVLAENGGALAKMLPAFKTGLAGILGDGRQYMSWIHLDDLVGQFIHIMEKNCKEQIYNGVSPSPVDNKAFTKTLGKELGRLTIIPVPKFALNIVLGEMSTLLLGSQKVLPTHFEKEDFIFNYKTLDLALKNLLHIKKNSEEKLKKYQWLEKPKEDVFDFFADEANLEKITPPSLHFKILNKTTAKIEEGTIINYKLRVHGVPLRWRTRINKFENNKYFIDEQIKGPYSKWVHTHSFTTVKGGTLIKDEVIYKIPFGLIGRLLIGAFIRRDIKSIFNYRTETIKKLI